MLKKEHRYDGIFDPAPQSEKDESLMRYRRQKKNRDESTCERSPGRIASSLALVPISCLTAEVLHRSVVDGPTSSEMAENADTRTRLCERNAVAGPTALTAAPVTCSVPRSIDIL